MTTIPENFCSSPWTMAYVSPNGLVGPCCRYKLNSHTAYGNLNNDTLENILNSDKAKILKSEFINNNNTDGNIRSSGCKTCWIDERIKIPSYRLMCNIRYKKQISDFLNYTTEDGHYNYTNINYWDIRPSNLCNLGCIMCTSELSSGLWQLKHDLNSFSSVQEKISPKFLKVNNESFKSTIEYIKNKIIENKNAGITDHFYFAGGEPLIMPEHKQIINMLEEENLYHVSLRYNTNLTSVVFKDINWNDVWKKFQRQVVIDASIDSTGEYAGIQRVGSDWDIIKNNLKLLSLNDNVSVTFNIVVSILTYPVLIETLKELEELFDNKYLRNNLRFTPLQQPDYLSLNSIEDKYIDYSIIHTANEMGYNVSELGTLLHNRADFVNSNNMKAINNQRNYIFNKLYKIKGIDVRTVLPWIHIDD